MKSRPKADSITYSRYQARKATVAGNTKFRNRLRSSTNRGSASIREYASAVGCPGPGRVSLLVMGMHLLRRHRRQLVVETVGGGPLPWRGFTAGVRRAARAVRRVTGVTRGGSSALRQPEALRCVQ